MAAVRAQSKEKEAKVFLQASLMLSASQMVPFFSQVYKTTLFLKTTYWCDLYILNQYTFRWHLLFSHAFLTIQYLCYYTNVCVMNMNIVHADGADAAEYISPSRA